MSWPDNVSCSPFQSSLTNILVISSEEAPEVEDAGKKERARAASASNSADAAAGPSTKKACLEERRNNSGKEIDKHTLARNEGGTILRGESCPLELHID